MAWCRENPSEEELFVRGEREARAGRWVTPKGDEPLKKQTGILKTENMEGKQTMEDL